MVRVEKLYKVFRDRKRGPVTAVDDLSFECRPGIILGILGLNGAGKTTTLRILATLLKPTSGNAWIDYISGDTGLYRRLTPREIVRYFGNLYGIPGKESDRRLAELAGRLEMSDFLDTKIDKLSSGQKQKVSIARTVLHHPQVLIMDEPTAGLDILASASIVEMIRNSKEQNRAVIFSTHMMHEAQKLCDEILIIHRGRKIRHGTIEAMRAETGIDDLDRIFIESVRAAG
jgi:sodium transport system ATP-binding protein